MVLNTMNDELNYILRESVTNTDFMFNLEYKRLIYVRSGDIRKASDPNNTFFRVLYDLPGKPMICLDIRRERVVFSLFDESDNDCEFYYCDYESAVFQESTIRELYYFNTESVGICKELAKMFYKYLDSGKRV